MPILVTVFIVYLGLPSVSPSLEFGPLTAAAIAVIAPDSAAAWSTRGTVRGGGALVQIRHAADSRDVRLNPR